jgi:hypothetical protein
MTAHSRIGASSMYRWSACPGSVRVSANVPRKSSSYADEGSDAHALAAVCLEQDQSPGIYTGKEVSLEGRKFTVTGEMVDAVDVYLDFVRSLRDDGDVLLVEQRFDLSSVHAGCFGTADAVHWQPAGKTLTVIDYKHGAGIAVEVENNPQLLYYGLGALLACKYPATKVRLVVVQPRCQHPDGPIRSHEVDAVDLIDFRADLKTYAKATEAPDAPLTPGKHCHFCPAAPLCPALQKRAQEVAKMEFAPSLPYDPAQLKLALDSREPLKAWLKALDEFAYGEAMAGRTPPGFKLVAKRAIRKWRSEGEVVLALQKGGINSDTIFEPREVRSPAQLEKLVGKELVAEFITSESSGNALVPADDKRPAVVLSSAKDDFSPVT